MPVPDTLIDLCSATSFANGQPVEMYRWLRENDPVHWHREPDGRGFWAVTRYDDIREISRQAGVFSNRWGMTLYDIPEADLEVTRHMLMFQDPPMHTAYRRLIAHDFIPRAASALRRDVDVLSTRIVDEVIEQGECEFVADIAGKLPSYFVAQLMGIPLADGVRLYELTETMHSAEASESERATARQEMMSYAADVFAMKRKTPADDLATELVNAQLDDAPLSDLDLTLYFLLIINAGGDTTRNLMAGGMLALLEHPSERALLRDDVGATLPTAVEEMLRYLSPVVYMRRTATSDIEMHGKRICAGDKVLLYYPSGNRDERVFEDPDRFDVRRHPNPHIAFGGSGPHYCLGSHLGRVEVVSMFRELLTRLPDMEQAGPATWLPSNFISGPDRLPVRFAPGRRSDTR